MKSLHLFEQSREMTFCGIREYLYTRSVQMTYREIEFCSVEEVTDSNEEEEDSMDRLKSTGSGVSAVGDCIMADIVFFVRDEPFV